MADSMDLKTFERKADELIQRLRWNDAVPVRIGEISQWQTLDAVPAGEGRLTVLRDLDAEVRMRELLGHSGYFGTQCVLAKAALYEAAAQEIARRAHAAGEDGRHLMWMEFRRMLSDRILSCYPSP